MSTSGVQTMFRFNQTQSVDSFGLDPEDNTSENQEHQLYQTLFQSLSQKPWKLLVGNEHEAPAIQQVFRDDQNWKHKRRLCSASRVVWL